MAIPSRMHTSNLLFLPPEIIQIILDYLWPKETLELLMAAPELVPLMTDKHLAYRDQLGFTILHRAVYNKAEVIVNFIAGRYAQNPMACYEGHTPLHLAISGGLNNIVKVLINAGFDLLAKDVMGRTLLHWACSFSHRHRNLAEIVQILIDAGGDVNALDMYGSSPLWDAVTNGHEDTLELLLASGADPHICTNRGTILHGAVAYQRENMVKRAVELGVDLLARNGADDTALMLATHRRYNNIAQILRDAGAGE